MTKMFINFKNQVIPPKRGFKELMKKGKKAISPIITTVLLVLIALVLAAIILLWARGFMKEQVAKFDQPIENLCEKVNLQASLAGNDISITNLGDIPVYKIGIRVSGAGASEIEYKEINLGQGGSATISSSNSLAGNSAELIPVLLGTSKKTEEVKEYNCLSNPLSVA